MLSKGNDNFATTVISTENVEKIGRSKKKESNLFFFLSYQATGLKVTFSGKILYFKNFDQECTQND